MKILLIADNKDLKEILSFQITSKFPISVKESPSLKDGYEILKKDENAFDLLICPYYGPESVLVKYLKERKIPLQAIFYFDPMILEPKSANIEGLACLGMVENTKIVDGIGDLIRPLLEQGVKGDENLEYCPIRTELLIRATPLKSDIYIRLSKDKFVMLFHSGDQFGKEDLQKYYDTKGVEYMYLKRNETAEFITQFRQDLDALLARTDLPEEEAIQASEAAQETVQDLVARVGFTIEVQELAKKNVELTLKTVGKNPKLNDILNRILTDGNYLSQHSTLLAQVSCCIAKEMEWGSEASFTKLVLASYMHDISVTNPKLARINTLKELEAKKAEFTVDEIKGYHLHPAKSADVVKSFQEIPADVDVIVLHHHERPNGSGFPRGLSHNYIAPLAAVFIVAHEMVQDIMDKKEKFSMPDFVTSKKPFYNQGNFKKVMVALEKVKL